MSEELLDDVDQELEEVDDDADEDEDLLEIEDDEQSEPEPEPPPKSVAKKKKMAAPAKKNGKPATKVKAATVSPPKAPVVSPKASKSQIDDAYGVDISRASLAAQAFKMADDPTRIKIVLLCDGERSVDEISKFLAISQPALSHHLALLRHSRLITATRIGKQNFYSLTRYGKCLIKSIKSIIESTANINVFD